VRRSWLAEVAVFLIVAGLFALVIWIAVGGWQ
jgi:hypothetical protein